MSRKLAPQHIKQFIGGLNTVESPLVGSVETSSDELNMLLNVDGSRQKRFGMDYENGFETIDSGIGYSASQPFGKSMYRWEGAGGDPETFLLVVQIGNGLYIFNASENNITSNLIFQTEFSSNVYGVDFSYADVDGILVIVDGEKQIHIIEYDSDSGVVSESSDILLIRDLFGVQAFDGDVELTIPESIEFRPTTLSSEHLYNLRNQTWAIPRIASNTEVLTDTIEHFFSDGSSTSGSGLDFNIIPGWRGSNPDTLEDNVTIVYPSNSDNVISQLKPDSADTQNRTVERFFAADLFASPLGSMEAPKGYFIIDAMDRGVSRLENEQALRENYPQLNYSVSDLPTDRTPGGPSTITQFAGRVWYGGFSGKVEGGDSKSPKLSSYIMFSLLVKDSSDITRCFQQGDPTSASQPDIIDTDGGFIRIDGAYGINKLIAVSGSLFVFASNGVWRVGGQNLEPFRATSYVVEKITERGCISSGSVVNADGNIIYWSENGIYAITQDNSTGQWTLQSLSKTTIQDQYLALTLEDKQSVKVFYDEFEQAVHWVYNRLESVNNYSEELIFDVEFAAFRKNRVSSIESNLPKIIDITGSKPYFVESTEEVVTVNGEDVQVNSVAVTATVDIVSSSTRETVYLTIIDTSTSIKFSISKYGSGDFYDWSTISPTNYEAYINTQSISAGEPRTRKGGDYLYAYFRRTETGFDEDLNPENASSCLLSYRYDWTNSNNANKWSTGRQAYRYRDVYVPIDSSDTFDNGQRIIWSKNKIRGSGRSIAFRFEAEEGKALHIYGWSYNMVSSDAEG